MEDNNQPNGEQIVNDIPKEPITHKTVSRKIIWILLLIIFFLLIILRFLYIKSKEIKQEQLTEKVNIERDEESSNSEEFEYNFPEGFLVTKEECNNDNNLGSADCIEVYKIVPSNFTDLEKKYLLSAYLRVFEKPEGIQINGQTSHITYDSQLKKWVFVEGEQEVLPERIEGKRIFVETSIGGSQAGSYHIIISDSVISTLLILSIPRYQRIECDFIEDVSEKRECESISTLFLVDSGGMLPDSVYEEKYSDLRESASTIW